MRSRSRNSVPFSLFAFQDIITSVTGIMILMTLMLALELIHKKQTSPEVVTPKIADQVAAAVASNEREIAECQRVLKAGVGAIVVDGATARKRLDELRRAREELEKQNALLAVDLQSAQTRQADIEREARQVTPEGLQKLKDEVTATTERLQRLKASNRVIFNKTEGEPKTPWLLEINRAEILAAEVQKTMKPLAFASADELLTWAKQQNARNVYFVLLVKPEGAERFSAVRESLLGNGFEIGYDLLASDQQAIDRNTGAGSE